MEGNVTDIHRWSGISVAALCAVVFAGTAGSAAAATLCVNMQGSTGCDATYPTIGAAVTAAAPYDTVRVGQGTYKEHVVIRKPLSLIGFSAANTTIDASGPGNGTGIYVDGMDNLTAADIAAGNLTGLSDVVVQGFTVANGGFEGILATNASNVTIIDNHVTGNNTNLVVPTNPAGCPFIPAWETSEGFDCGEGIHLDAVHHSTVANNMVDHNAGGILMTDETGPNHDNLISGNLVTENGYDCGITLASHRPAFSLGYGSAFNVAYGVFRNTVANNEVSKNGLLVSGNGTGIGLFTSPGPPTAPTMKTATYDNVVVGNRLIGNGQPGVAMHIHKAGGKLTGNLIAGNYIADNGRDVADNATAGPTGINIHAGNSGEPMTGNVVTGNIIERQDIDVAISTSSQINVHLNDLKGGGFGVVNLGTGKIDATMNWWGCAQGPTANGCSAVDGAVTYTPWLTKPAHEE